MREVVFWAAAISLLFPALVRAGMDFGGALPVAPTSAASDLGADDSSLAMATDGQGVWISAWSQFPGGTLGISGQGAPVFSRSLDDGKTWSSTALVRPEASNSVGSDPVVATDTHGKWILVWNAHPSELRATSSTENGQNWIASSVISPPGSGLFNFAATIDTDRAGVWVVAWTSAETLGGTIGSDYDILFVRSSDGGGSWSAPAPLNTTATIDSPASHDVQVRIATDHGGTWVAVWSTFAQTWVSRSVDNALTWSVPVSLSHVGWQGTSRPSVATDGEGRWVVTWTNYDSADSGEVVDIWYSYSSDDGTTWAAESKLHPHADAFASGYDDESRVVSLGDGTWAVVWDLGQAPKGGTGDDTDLRISISRDSGQLWSSPAALTVRSRFDGDAIDFSPAFAASTGGTRVVAWASQDSLGGTIGSDYDVLFARAERDCPAIARNDCRVAEAGGSSLRLRDKVGGADSLKWRWRSRIAGSDADLGDPVSTDSYAICLYEKVGGAAGLIGEWDAKVGGSCRGVPCWTKVTGNVSFTDRDLERGSIKRLSVRSDTSGSAVKLQAGGPALALPRLPLDPSTPVRIQLVNTGTGVCWDGTHTTAAKNELEQFSSVSE